MSNCLGIYALCDFCNLLGDRKGICPLTFLYLQLPEDVLGDSGISGNLTSNHIVAGVSGNGGGIGDGISSSGGSSSSWYNSIVVMCIFASETLCSKDRFF